MYDKLITKMTNNFSLLGSIMHSKACEYSRFYPITKDDIYMYYNLLKSEDKKHIPSKISINNHLSCCLFYLAKDSNDFMNLFIEKYLKSISFENFEITEENLVLTFNIMEFDKTYLHSQKEKILFLYELLKQFTSFWTGFENFLLFMYFRAHTKFLLGDYAKANEIFLKIMVEIPCLGKPDFFLKYIILRNKLLKIELFGALKSEANFKMYSMFLEDLYYEVKKENKTIALRIGFDLFSSYLEIENYHNCIPLLLEMKNILKKDLLKGSSVKNYIDYYLAIANRLGYIGILLEDKKAINSAVKKIKKFLTIIKKDKNNTKIANLAKAYTFAFGILKMNLNKITNFDLKKIACEYRNFFFPDLEYKSNYSSDINEENRENIIFDFQIINNMNIEIAYKAISIILKIEKEININNIGNIIMNYISSVLDKVKYYSNKYISNIIEKQRKFCKEKIEDYFHFFINIFYEIYRKEPLLNTKLIKIKIIEIYSYYAHIFIYEQNISQIEKAINYFDDIKTKLQIEADLPAFGLIYKIRGDYCSYQQKYKEAISYYEDALKLLEKNEPKIASVLYNNGCAYFFLGNKRKAKEYLNKSIKEYNEILMKKDISGFALNVDKIKQIIYSAEKLMGLLPL